MRNLVVGLALAFMTVTVLAPTAAAIPCMSVNCAERYAWEIVNTLEIRKACLTGYDPANDDPGQVARC